jgi:hypothetical protein
MRELIDKFTKDYMLNAETNLRGMDERRIINNPIVYLFVGDESLAALQEVYSLNQRKWKNHDGIVYMYVYSEKQWSADNVFSLNVARIEGKSQSTRPTIYQSFLNDEEKLVEYNQLLRQLSEKLSETGTMFHMFKKINLSVITSITDPINVILPDLTILMENALSSSFTMVYLDAFCLLEEKGVEEEKVSLGISFLMELQDWQNTQFTYSKETKVTKDKIRMNVNRSNGPLFDLVYLLGDKDERGVLTTDSMQKTYEIISTINLLKNRYVSEAHHMLGNAEYNNVQFKKNIQHDNGTPSFVSAGFSKVTRPNREIALHVLHFFFRHILQTIKNRSRQTEEQKMFEMLEIDASSVMRIAESFVPHEIKIEEMLVLMPASLSFNSLKQNTLKEAENALYHNASKEFFEENFVEHANKESSKFNGFEHVRDLMIKRVIENPKYGFYAALIWSNEEVIQHLITMKASFLRHYEDEEDKLEQIYDEYVETQKFSKSLFSSSTTTRNFISHLLKRIYGQKRTILTLRKTVELVVMYISSLEALHMEMQRKLNALEELEKDMKLQADEAVFGNKSRITENIPEYYERVVNAILREKEEKRSTDFYFEDKYLGDYSKLMENESFIERVMQMIKDLIFQAEELNQPFEKEILERGNVKISYGDPEVLTQEELFKELYHLLENDSACQIYLQEYSQNDKYEEKYYFGDYESSFIKYALSLDKENRGYKLGCIHEKRTSGIEKLSLLGGFSVEDLLFYKNNRKYYDIYQKNGYKFHAEEALNLFK